VGGSWEDPKLPHARFCVGMSAVGGICGPKRALRSSPVLSLLALASQESAASTPPLKVYAKSLAWDK
jgi:hypothetical protein